MKRMQASYAVIRYIPSILREEFINVGVILVCPEAKYQGVQALPSFDKDKGKLSMFEDADGYFVRHAITKLSNAAEEKRFDEFVGAEAAPDGLLTVRGFTTLSGTYHNNIRLTEPRTLLTADPKASLQELYDSFVGVQEREEPEVRITREKMRAKVTQVFNHFGLFKTDQVEQRVKPVPGSTRVDIAYRNGVMNFYQLIPFVNPDAAVKIASSYRTVAADVRNPNSDLGPEYEQAKFAVLGYFAPAQGDAEKELEAIKERLEDDHIELLDYRKDTPKVAQRIRKELDASNNMLHVSQASAG